MFFLLPVHTPAHTLAYTCIQQSHMHAYYKTHHTHTHTFFKTGCGPRMGSVPQVAEVLSRMNEAQNSVGRTAHSSEDANPMSWEAESEEPRSSSLATEGVQH